MEKDVRKNKRYLMEWETRGLGHEYNEWRNMRYFGNLMIVFIFILCNIVFDKVEWLSFICDVDMTYSITLKSYLPFYELFFFFFFLCLELKLFAIKLLLAQHEEKSASWDMQKEKFDPCSMW